VDRLLEVREMLEVPAAGLAAVRHEPAQLDALRATLFDPGRIATDDLFSRNRSFHEALLRMTGNPLLEVVTQPVFRVLGEKFLREAAPKRFWSQVDADHRAILAAVAAGDQATASGAMHEHLGRLRAVYTRIDRERTARRSTRGPRSGTPFLDRQNSDV
jgi:GntR family transcriptional repressor for pyruvate dehydrogenase complex